VVNEAMRAYSFAPASEPKLTNPTEVQDAIRGLKVGKAPGPDGIPNRALKHLPLSIVSLLVVFNAILRTLLPGGLEARTRVFNPETRERPGAALVLSTHKSTRHDWQTVRENPALQDSPRSERTWITARRAVWIQTQTARRYSSPALWREYPGTLTRRD